MKLPCVREESQVHGVHHQLDAHEDGDAVPAGEHATDADGEEDGAEDEKVMCRDHDCTFCIVRPESSSAPTMAARSRIETASNGKRYDSKSFTPIARASAMNR